MNSSYLPAGESDRVTWLNNFSAHLGTYATVLGLSNNDLSSVQRDAAMFAYIVQQCDAAHTYSSSMTNIKKLLKSSPQQLDAPAFPTQVIAGPPPAPVASGIFNRVSMLVVRIKQHSAYTNVIGQDLGIIPPVSTTNPNDMTPNLSVRLDAGHPLLKWIKGAADGVQLYVDRRDTNGFVQLAKVFRNNYLDVSSLPPNVYAASWDYKAKYLIGDDEVGQFSPTVTVEVFRTA